MMGQHSLQIAWLGHSCFAVEGGRYRIIIDPFDPRPGLPILDERAQMVLTSHEHADHNYVQAVEILPADAPCPFAVSTYPSYHDQQQGTQRGKNTIHQLDYQDLRVVHLGDLDHELSEETIATMGLVDVLMIPVGGYYTIDAKEAAAICNALAPRVIMPMHFRVIESQPIGPLEDFLTQMEEWQVDALTEPEYTLTKKSNQRIVVFSRN